MEQLKRFFIAPYSMGLFVAVSHGVYGVLTHGVTSVWLGVLIATLPGAFFFGKIFVTSTARTSDRWPALWLFSIPSLVLVLWLPSSAVAPIIYIVVFGLVGGLLYDFWYSRLPNRDKSTLAVGALLPDFTLHSADGQSISSSQLRESPALILFYRGNWCPLCMAQIKEVAAQYRALNERGVAIYLVSNQSHENTQSLAERFDVPMNFLVDQQGQAARQLGILAEGGTPAGIPGYEQDTSLPTVVITDANGKIIFADLTDNYRVRPEPETFLKVIDGVDLAHS